MGKYLALILALASSCNITNGQVPKDFVYVSKRGGYAQIFIRQNGKDKQLTFEGDNYRPKLSPDGKVILFDSDKTGFSQLYLIDIDGTNLRNISNCKWNESGGSWSHDGKQIVYSSDQNRKGNGDIYLRSKNGNNNERLTSEDYLQWRPVMCPDGSCVVFSAEVDRNEDIFKLDLSTSKLLQLTDSRGRDGWATIDSKGKKILFHSERTGQSEIFEMNLDGSDQVQLTNYEWDGFFPSYVESEGKIVGVLYSSEYRNHKDWDIYLLDYKTKALTKVVDGSSRDFQPNLIEITK